MRLAVYLLAALVLLPLVHAEEAESNGTQTLGALTITLTTDPVQLSPSEATMLLHVTRDGAPAVDERLRLRLVNRGHARFDADVVTDEQGVARVATYLNNAGEYTLTVTNADGAITFPVDVRGTTVLVTGLLAASAVLLALLFERKLHRS